MESLKRRCLIIEDGTEVYYPQFGESDVIFLPPEFAPKFNGCFSINNSTVAFFDNKKFYVTPYTSEVVKKLYSNGFQEKSFYVPLSNGEIPVNPKLQGFWQGLIESVAEYNRENFAKECAKWCDEYNIRPIGEEHLKDCFRMPIAGVPVRFRCFEDIYYPICDKVTVDSFVRERLGRYCRNNGKVVFVYRDGETYVAKGYGIIKHLRNAGFKEGGLFVPFSNNEEITDPHLRSIWDAIPKKK